MAARVVTKVVRIPAVIVGAGMLLLSTAHRLPAPIAEETTPTPAESTTLPKSPMTRSSSSGEKDFLKQCPLEKGDSISKVKEFFSVSYDPQKFGNPIPGGTAYQYHFAEYGVWIFLDGAMRVQTLRFDRPFSGKIDGVAVGDPKAAVVKLKGQPTKKFQGLPDTDEAVERKNRATEIIESLPDPASKKLVRKAFSDVEALNALPPVWDEAWTYSSGDHGFVRYDFSSAKGRVQTILTDKGTGEKER